MQELDLYRLSTIEAFPMVQLGRTRRVQVYLPKGYTDSSRSYPVIYMHDGQTIFDGENAFGGRNWHVHSSLDHFFDDQSGVILVGIDNGAEYDGLCRMYEYSPWPMDQGFELPSWDPAVKQSGGQGKAYVDFIVNELKPYIDANYRTQSQREFTAIAGSSMGGYISLYAALEHPNVFSKAGVFSPALWFNEQEMLAYLNEAELHQSMQVYLDMGTDETSDHRLEFEQIYLAGAEKLKAVLGEKPLLDLKYVVVEGDKHDGDAWGRRFPIMLEHFYAD